MKRILIIDDERAITDSLKIGLQRRGFEVETYNDAVDAISKFEPGRYDLVLVDIRMPRMNGFDVYRELSKLDKSVKICFLTSFDVYREEFSKIFPNVEIASFLKKPITIAELTTKINEMTAS